MINQDIGGSYTPVTFSEKVDPHKDDLDKYGNYCLYCDGGRIRHIIGGGLYRDAQRDAEREGLNYLFEPCPPGDWHKWYVVDGEYVARPPLPYTLDGLVLKGVPDGATITIENKDYTADGTDIELEFSHAGTYDVVVDSFPFEVATITVTYEATA